MSETVKFINHYQKSIEKNRTNNERLIHCLNKLFNLKGITVQHLQETGIGKTVNSLRKHSDPEVCMASKSLVAKWKAMVADESDEDHQQANENGNDEDDEDGGNPKNNFQSDSNEPARDMVQKTEKYSSSVSHHKPVSSKHEKSESSYRKESTHQHHNYNSSSSTDKDIQKEKRKEEKSSEKYTNKHHDDRNGHHNSQSGKSPRKDYKDSSSHSEKSSKSHKRSRSPADEESRKSKLSKIDKESNELKEKNETKDSEKAKSSHERSHKSSSSSKGHKSSSSKSHSKSDSGSSKSSKKKVPEEKVEEEIEFDCAGGMGFAEALASFDVPRSSKKSSSTSVKKPTEKKSNSTTSSSPFSVKPSTSKSSSEKMKPMETLTSPPKSLTDSVRLAPLPDIARLTPEFGVDVVPETVQITNDYRPMPMSSMMMDYVFSTNNKAPKKNLTDEELLTQSFSSKANRTKVFSGNKTYRGGHVPKLFDMCIRVLQENIEFLEYTGGVPFDLLKPVLEKATPDQLNNLEYFNPYLIDESDVLWEPHCKRKFRGQQPQEMESWRDMYARCVREQENKLKSLTEVIRRTNEQNSAAIKKSKIAFEVKAPRSVVSKQIKFGTKHLAVTSPAARVSSLNVGVNVAKAGDARARVAAGIRDTAMAAVAPNPMKKRAPLMAKALQFKRQFKR